MRHDLDSRAGRNEELGGEKPPKLERYPQDSHKQEVKSGKKAEGKA